MELSVHFIDFLPGAPDRLAPTITQAAVAAEEAGATMFTLADHFFQMQEMGRAQDPFLDAYTTLAFLAGQTRTIALAPLVTGVTYRHPGVLAKTATTVDVLSGGRLVFGIGAAWYEREHLGLGVPYPPVRAIRDARRDAADLPADVERGPGALRGQALSVGGDDL
jgi:alkanesulfonate monooxygenase SsuD/methylene tetrahydromethanopterin reductase-like flavin-dependent oxidoreductase (luciferase family)